MLIGPLKNGPISIKYCIFRSSYVGDYLLYVNRWIHQMHQHGVWPIRELEVIIKDSTWTARGFSDIGHVDVYPVVDIHPNVDILSTHQYEKLYMMEDASGGTQTSSCYGVSHSHTYLHRGLWTEKLRWSNVRLKHFFL